MSNSARPLIYAHRGASLDHPENTLPAFVGAFEQGSDWVELDVQLTRDGGLVVHHDPVYPDGRTVEDHDAAARPPTVPLLNDALDACAGMGVNIEIKVERPGTDLAERVVAVVGARRDQGVDQPISISSFDETVLDRVKVLDPSIDIAQLLLDMNADPHAVERAAERGAVAIHPWDPFVDEALMDRCRSLGLAVNPWTVDDRDRIIQLGALGVDGIITNVPAIALGYLS